MKIILVLIAFYALWWLLRRSFGGTAGSRASKRPAQPANAPVTPQPMLACAFCGVHLPRDETLPGRGGVFCGEPHRAAFEKANPKP